MQHFAKFSQQLKKSWASLTRGVRLPIYLGLLATIFVLWMHLTEDSLFKPLLDRLEYIVYDMRFKWARPVQRPNSVSIVIVNYDDKSLKAEGQWPWSRFKIGDLVKKLADDGAVVIGFDVFFPEFERNLVKELNQRVEGGLDTNGKGKALLPQLAAAPAALFDGDAYFAASMGGSADVVLGFSFRDEKDIHEGGLPEPVFKIKDEDREDLTIGERLGYTGNNKTLQDAAAGAGFFDTIPDSDGVIRKTPLVIQYEGHVYPSLALDMARRFNVTPGYEAMLETDATGKRTFTGIKVAQTEFPTDKLGMVKVPYIGGKYSFPYISATDILHDTLSDTERSQLQNSLVLVGTDATGLYDLRSTPLEPVYPGVEVHANVLNALLSSQDQKTIDASGNAGHKSSSQLLDVFAKAKTSPFPVRPDWESGAVRFAIVFIGVGLALVYPYLGPALLALSSFSFVVGLIALNVYLWSNYNLDVSLVVFLILVVILAVINMAYGFLKEGMSRKMIKGMFDQYVPPAHIDAMLNDPDKYNFSGESKELSVLFSDIRSFTTISEKLKATELKEMLNEFFTPITGIIFDNHGTIDKYVGDMVMAFWGAPLDDPRHREHAVRAALMMLKKVEELKPVFRAKGLPEVNIGIGINSGMMNVGDMGSTYRRAYTVIGDAVNLGSRLESITKVYGVKLLIGEQTYDNLKGVLCRQVDKVQVKGKDEPIRIYQPLCLDSEANDELKAAVREYHDAYALYLAQQWDAAKAAFEVLKTKDPDTYLYSLYLERIETLRQHDLPRDWDGTYRHTSK